MMSVIEWSELFHGYVHDHDLYGALPRLQHFNCMSSWRSVKLDGLFGCMFERFLHDWAWRAPLRLTWGLIITKGGRGSKPLVPFVG